MKSIQNVTQLYAALRSIIPNLPDGGHVIEVTIKCGPMDEIPTCTIVQCCLDAKGRPYVEGEGADTRVATEVQRFMLVPEQRFADYVPVSNGVVHRVKAE